MNLGMVSLGCAKNLIDTELFLGLASKYNIQIVSKINEADIIVINTCGFLESAKKESIDTILEMIDYQKSGKKIVVIGCLVERYLNDLKKELPEVDYFIPIHDYHHLDNFFNLLTNKNYPYEISYTNRIITTSKASAYLRIGDGCNNRCSYCAIPLIRGAFKSRMLDDIILEAKYLASKGIKELTIIAQDTSKYGEDLDNVNLAILLQKIADLNKFKMIRVLYLYPDEITDELILTIKNNQVIANYFDIPIQHASDRILKNMNRRGNNNLISNVINKIREMIPDAIIRTTLIVGFPDELDEDFTTLKKYVQKMHFERMGVFTYSNEEDTVAYNFTNQIDDAIKNKRYNEIMSIQKDISRSFNLSQINKKYEVIIDGFDYNKQLYQARSYMQAPDGVDGYIYVSGNNLEIGKYYDVIITDANSYDLFASII